MDDVSTKNIPEPSLLPSAIDKIEFMIKAAKEGFVVDQYMAHFFGKVLFAMQLWRINKMGWEIKVGAYEGG